MVADLDTLYTVVYCTAGDLLPAARANARRRVTDAELVTLCVAQAIMGVPSDRRFLRTARRALVHLFPALPSQSAQWRRRRRLAGAIEWVMGVFASDSPEPAAYRRARRGRADETLALADPARGECEVALELLERAACGGAVLVCDKGYAGREFAARASELGVTVVRRRRTDEAGEGPRLAPVRERTESIFWTCKDPPTL